MCDMDAPKLPIPNPEDWTDRNGAARLLGVDPATVSRMADDGRLKVYPIGTCRLFWRPQVNALAEARRIAGIGRDD